MEEALCQTIKGPVVLKKISNKLKYCTCTLLTKGCYVSSLIKTGQMVLEKKVFFRVENLFLIFHFYLPFWLKLVLRFWRKGFWILKIWRLANILTYFAITGISSWRWAWLHVCIRSSPKKYADRCTDIH